MVPVTRRPLAPADMIAFCLAQTPALVLGHAVPPAEPRQNPFDAWAAADDGEDGGDEHGGGFGWMDAWLERAEA
jgi:hypothetical protein